VIKRFARFPAAFASQARTERFADVPALLAHPDWENPAPVVLWLHGRTVNKELDPGRYLRWIRAGVAVCAIDLPGHGERAIEQMQSPRRSLDVIEQVIPEIDQVVHELGEPRWGGAFDGARVGIGGMSGGGMAVLRRLCDPHRFVCASVEGTTGNLAELYHPASGRPWAVEHPQERITRLDAMQNLERWRPIPLQVLHSEADRIVPYAGQREFIERLREHYARAGADPSMIEVKTWKETGAPEEHSGFGRYSNDAKNAQVAFFQRCFGLV
jgi:alpha-beta hydrolase superfamily lysophospholipase